MQDENPASVVAVEDATRRLDELSVTRTTQLRYAAAAFRMTCQLLDVSDGATDELGSRVAILDRDVVRDRLEIGQRGFRPDYFSHFPSRRLASA